MLAHPVTMLLEIAYERNCRNALRVFFGLAGVDAVACSELEPATVVIFNGAHMEQAARRTVIF